MKELPKRKPNRLKNFDYSQNGAYFITICTRNREPILSHITVGTSIARPQAIHLTDTGKIVDTAIREIPNRYAGVFVDRYVIMPNHIHLIIRMETPCGQSAVCPTISRIIQQLKGYATKQAGKPLWQNKAYDHIIRDDYDYMTKYQYIDDNPANWLLKRDEYN